MDKSALQPQDTLLLRQLDCVVCSLSCCILLFCSVATLGLFSAIDSRQWF